MKVCLIGNNLTSLILAHILSKKNISSEIYCTKSHKNIFRTRTLGITENNIKYLNKYFKEISKKINPINEIEVLVENEKISEEIKFQENSTTLFNMVNYNKLATYINRKIRKNKNIKIKLKNKRFNLSNLLDNKKFDLIINCERSNILTKKYLNIKINKNYFNKAFTTIIKHKSVKNNKAKQIFTKYGPLAFLPLSRTETSIVFSLEENKINKVSNDIIFDFVKKFNTTYKITSHENSENFHLYFRLPKNYFYKNILFFGDSIHTIHPLAGQGFNMTVRDIKKLIEILEKRQKLGLGIDKNVFNEFQQSSKNHNTIFSFGVDFIYEFFKFNNNYLPAKVSKKIFSKFNQNNMLKKLSIKLANSGISY